MILDWVPAHFPRDAHGLACFDGTCVYEHQDPRKGSHPHWGTLIYNYGRPEVSNFLIANALFWTDKYHADGIRMDAVASMLYLDYGKQDGEWVANIYGGNENLEAVEFLKHLSSVFHGRKDGAVLIAEESTAWPQVTGKPEDGGLGFDFKWNMGWMNDFTSYMRCDPYFRKYNYGELTFSMLYAYSENFVLVFSHDEVVHGKGSMIGKMPGETLEKKAQNLRAAYGFMTGHPGKKLLFMGQDFAQVDEWNENASLEWNLLEYPVHQQTQDYVKALNHLYRTHPALYEMDYDPEGFQWINCSYDQDSMVIFIRRSKKADETLLFVCNFDNMAHEKFRLGVPFAGKYKEILNSDAVEFGGTGMTNPRVKTSKAMEWDELENSIEIRVAPMSCCVFSCTPTEEEKPQKSRKGEKTSAAKAAEASKASENSGAEKKEENAARKTGVRTVKDKVRKLAEKKDELGKKAVQTVESVQKLASEKVEKLTTRKTEPEKLATKKVEAEKLTTKKVEPEKLSTKKVEVEKLSTKKVEAEKLTTKKVEPAKLSTKKVEPEKLTAKKAEPEKDFGKNDDEDK